VVADGPWGAIEDRPLPPLALTVDAPATLSLAAPLAADERRMGCRVFVPGFRKGRGTKLRFPYAASIHSPRAQHVRLGAFWGPHWLNGEAVAGENDAVCGNRQNLEVDLAAGWNLLYGEPEQLTESWAMVLAWPRAAGLRVAADSAEDAPEAMRYGAAVEAERLPSAQNAVPADSAALDALDIDWRLAPTTATNTTPHPARDCAWDRPGDAIAYETAADFPLELVGDHVLVYDFCREFLGTVTVELEAPAGTVVDIANDERRRDDGLLGLYATNPFTDTADRFVCRGGRQVIEGFHPRGGRWLQLALRPPADGRVVLHRVAITSAQVPVRRDGRFESSEPVFDWCFEAGLATLRACVEDAFLDCPWRERGTYLGDALVEQSALASVTGDLAVARRSLELWAQGQLPDGQMQACVPSWHRRPHEDFSLWWIPAVRDYWALTGDVAFVRRYHAVIERIFASPSWQEQDGALWTAEGLHSFIDWGATRSSKQGRGNACLNAIRVLARDAAAELAELLGDADAAAGHRAEAERVREGLRLRLWLADAGRFAARLDDQGAADAKEAARHANALLVLAGVPDAEQLAATWAFLEAELAHNLADGCTRGQGTGHCELYFLYYVLRACYAHDRVALAERLMREHWGLLMRADAWTLWECFCRGVHGAGSQCHAWSCGPLAMLREQVLGVRWVAGDPTRVTVAPNSHLTWARGTVPHPAGGIAVHWRRHADRLFLAVDAPDGVEVELAAGAACRELELVCVGSAPHS